MESSSVRANLAGALGRSGQSGAGPIWEPVFMGAHLEPGLQEPTEDLEPQELPEIRPLLGYMEACVQRNTLGATLGLWSQPGGGVDQCWGLQ